MIAAIAIYAAATLPRGGRPSEQPRGAPGAGVDVSAAPLADGTRASLDEAAALVPFPVLRPNIDLASDTSIAEVWVRTSWDPEVLIEYSSGVRVEVRRSPFTGTPQDFYRAQIAEGVPGRVVSIKGVDVFIVPQGEEGDLGSATIVVDDLLVMIVGDGDFSVDQLKALAASVLGSATPSPSS